MYAHARLVAVPVLKSGRRQLRLFACACCRQVWHLLGDEGRAAVEAAEGYADDRATPDDLRKALNAAWSTTGAGRLVRKSARGAAVYAARPSITSGAFQAAAEARRAVRYAAEGPRAAFAAAGRLQCELLRDIFNPFRPVRVGPAWLRWNDGTVRKLAQALYDERSYDRWPILADALEDAGCDQADLLGHLRGPGPHVRGCWAIDLLLGN
jgi:hypothetical protein